MKRKILRGLLLAAIVFLAFEGCNLLPVSVEARVEAFLDDVNNTDRGGIYLNFHPTLTVDYDAIRSPAPPPDWDAPFPIASIPFSISSLDTSDPWDVTGMVDSPAIGWVSKPIVFRMSQDGMDWMIQQMTFDTISIN
jgi:hypothetical protein